MKPIFSPSGIISSSLVPTLALCASFALAPSLRAGSADPAPATAEEVQTPPNWIDFGLGGLILHGDHGQAAQQLRLSDNLFGGIQDMHLEHALGNDFVAKLDGHAIFGNDDYRFNFEISKEDLGYIRAGYSQYRTWYDGNGGYYPYPSRPGGQFLPPEKNVDALDRRNIFIELGLRNPMQPEVTLRYERDTRHGQKDSTIWGDTSLTGGMGIRKIVPSFRNINEVRDVFRLDISQTIGNTDLHLGGRYEHLNNDNSLNLESNPDQLGHRYVTQHDTLSEDMFSTHGYTETRFGEKVWFTLGYAYTTFNTDIGGSRVYGPGYDSEFDPTKTPPIAAGQGFYQLVGGSEWGQNVANMNIMWKPNVHLSLIGAVRLESQRNDNTARFVDTLALGDHYALTPYEENSSNDTNKVAESLELRYTGIANWLFHARGEWTEETGTVWDQVRNASTQALVNSADIDRTRHVGKYEVGANWYACRQATFSAQYYYKDDENDYSNSGMLFSPASLGSPAVPIVNFPGRLTAQNFVTNDVNTRMTLRPFSNLSLVSQYDFQRLEIDTRDSEVYGGNVADTGKTTNHVFSESITWSPLSRLYVQAGATYFQSKTETPATVTVANLASPGRLLSNESFNFKNDHWTLNLSAGFAFDEKTNLQADYTFYKASNYEDVALYTQPYGAGAEQQTVTLTLNRKLRANVTANVKCGYFQYTDETSGGYNNYSGVLLFTGLQVRF